MKLTEEERQLLDRFKQLESKECRDAVVSQLETMVRAREMKLSLLQREVYDSVPSGWFNPLRIFPRSKSFVLMCRRLYDKGYFETTSEWGIEMFKKLEVRV